MAVFVNFTIPKQTIPGANLTIFTTRYGSGSFTHKVDNEGLWQSAHEARDSFAEKLAQSLSDEEPYPLFQAEAMLDSLRWVDGLSALLEDHPSLIKFNISRDTSILLPELVPIPNAQTLRPGANWLDCLAPIYRSLEIGQVPVQYLDNKSVAIIFQDGEPISQGQSIGFADLANEIYKALQQSQIEVDLYQGSRLVNFDPALLSEIFHKHRAILFLCSSNDVQGGWKLTDNADTYLSLGRLHAFLDNRIANPGVPVPEIIFSIGRVSDWSQSARNTFPPTVLLNLGIKYYVGTWMDAVSETRYSQPYWEALYQLTVEFLSRWAKEPQGAVRHLYEAKQACGFHPLTSLFQMYVNAGEQGGEAAFLKEEDYSPREPIGARISALAEGDILGPYRLEKKLWETAQGKTFFARKQTSASRHLIEVLADEWQNKPEIQQEITAAIQKLQDAQLRKRHLIPDRQESVAPEHAKGMILDVLIYDRPDDESSEDWVAFEEQTRTFGPRNKAYLPEVRDFGEQIATLLAELHKKRIRHGNFSPLSIVTNKPKRGKLRVFLKDAWVYQTRKGRSAAPQYVAPEESRAEEGLDELKYDCFALGRILYEIAADKPYTDETLKEILQHISSRDPDEALRKIISECLTPSARVRPDSDDIATTLGLAAETRGSYLDRFEANLDQRIRAGQRLFAVYLDDVTDLHTSLMRLNRKYDANKGYCILLATEGVGLTDLERGNTINFWHWTSAEEIQQAEMAETGVRVPLPNADHTALYNAFSLVDAIPNIINYARPKIPLLLVHGSGWWAISTKVWRQLIWSQAQNPSNYPVFIIADRWIGTPTDMTQPIEHLNYPPLSPSELYNHIIHFGDAQHLNIPPIPESMAVKLAVQLSPCSRLEATMALRMCALKYGVIDSHAALISDESRQQVFRSSHGATYTPTSELPDPSWMALPSNIASEVQAWLTNIKAFEAGATGYPPLRRVLISGKEGSGKTTLAFSIAAQLEYPLVRIDPEQCLQGGLGQSEKALRQLLSLTFSLNRAVVLFDNLDRFLDPAMGGLNDRMASILLDYLDTAPIGLVIIMVCRNPNNLPLQWRRRADIRLQLPDPSAANYEDYRAQIFAVLFRKHNLALIANNDVLMRQLAERTFLQQMPIPSPVARIASGTALANQVVHMETASDIEGWIVETILLHAHKTGNPESEDFWRLAAALA